MNFSSLSQWAVQYSTRASDGMPGTVTLPIVGVVVEGEEGQALVLDQRGNVKPLAEAVPTERWHIFDNTPRADY